MSAEHCELRIKELEKYLRISRVQYTVRSAINTLKKEAIDINNNSMIH